MKVDLSPGVYVAGDSGAYLNPAITFTNCMFRRLPWRRFPMYFLAQLLGGFVAAGVVYANYINGINALEGHNIRTVPPSPTATAGIFCTVSRQMAMTANLCLRLAVPADFLDQSKPVLLRVHCEYDPHVCHFRVEGRYKQRRVERGR